MLAVDIRCVHHRCEGHRLPRDFTRDYSAQVHEGLPPRLYTRPSLLCHHPLRHLAPRPGADARQARLLHAVRWSRMSPLERDLLQQDLGVVGTPCGAYRWRQPHVHQ